METILQYVQRRINEDADVYVDLEKKSMKVGRKWVVVNGASDFSSALKRDGSPAPEQVLEHIAELYATYKTSVPSERDDYASRYFKALTAYELTDEQLINNPPRRQARAMLESYVLLCFVFGWIAWSPALMGGSYFWQCPTDKDLVILRQWL